MNIGDWKPLPKRIICCCCKIILQTILVSRGYRLCFPKIVGILDDAESMFWISGISQRFVLQIICWLLTFGACYESLSLLKTRSYQPQFAGVFSLIHSSLNPPWK